MVMPVACAAAETVGDVMDALRGRCGAGLTPLHLAVRTGSAELVRCCHWRVAHVHQLWDHLFSAEAKGSAGRECNSLT